MNSDAATAGTWKLGGPAVRRMGFGRDAPAADRPGVLSNDQGVLQSVPGKEAERSDR
jgi:hypothetical protein